MDELESILSAEAGPDPRIGEVLSQRYRIERRLGKGGMGVVYEATHLMIEKRVAVKLMHPELAAEGEAVARFRREAIAASKLAHPNIIEVTDMGRAKDGAVFMVLELLEGRDWSDDLEEEPIPPLDTTLHVIGQVCSALSKAHAAGILHRDLKPENIFLIEREGDRFFAKVVDFGVSKILDASTKLSRTGMAVGTPYFMSPEQLRGQSDIDHRTDIWAIGVMLYQTLTGRFPFEADALPTLAVKVLSEEPVPVWERRPDLPVALGELVARMLAKDPDQRPASCDEIRDALLRLRGTDERRSGIPPREAPAAPGDRDDALAATMASAPGVRAEADAGLAGAALAETGLADPAALIPATSESIPAAPKAASGGPSRRQLGVALAVVVGLAAIGAVVGVTSLSGEEPPTDTDVEPVGGTLVQTDDSSVVPPPDEPESAPAPRDSVSSPEEPSASTTHEDRDEGRRARRRRGVAAPAEDSAEEPAAVVPSPPASPVEPETTAPAPADPAEIGAATDEQMNTEWDGL